MPPASLSESLSLSLSLSPRAHIKKKESKAYKGKYKKFFGFVYAFCIESIF